MKKEGLIEGVVVKIIDGDTFDIEGEEKRIRIRLAGADAPEYPKGCLGLKAKERLTELVLGKKIKIEQIEEDNFGRKIGFVQKKKQKRLALRNQKIALRPAK